MMSLEEIYFQCISEISNLIQKKEVSPVEVVEAYLSRIESLEPKLNSFITILYDQAREEAKKAEKEIQMGNYFSPLHGIPYGLKDIFYVKGIKNTAGSKIFDHFIPNFDSTIAFRLKKAGAILLGKLNLHPFAYGVTGENEEYGNMHNPWDTKLITGGSSGGSGAAVASGQSPFAIGSDTGGSIRIPSALCGIVGFKPTYGRLSRYGMTALAWSQDHPGPMTRTVKDCAFIMNSISGYDPNDPTSSKIENPDYLKALSSEIRGLRIGVIKEISEAPIESEVKESFIKALDHLTKLGTIVEEISWPIYRYSMPIASIIQMAEATSYHRELIIKNGAKIYSPVRLRLEAGIFITASDYISAQRARTLFFHESMELFKKIDLIATPTVPVTAFPIGKNSLCVSDQKINVVSLLTQYTRPFNLNGFPAISIPCGFSKEDLPIGLQLVGRPFDESTVLCVAHAYEQSTEWHLRRPPL
jgi:aspartyl-tRNA(Asn)/glutamyl-tRNA(Gln) amidotransferase subunit A